MSKDKIAVALLLDRSYSMISHRTETISAVNAYIDSLKKKYKGSFTLVLFNSRGIDKFQSKIKDIPQFTADDYQPWGNTPLFDAIGETMSTMATEGYDNVTFAILTDGQENDSKEFTLTAVKTLIETRQKEGWQIVYLGADVDAFLEAEQLGIGRGQTMSFSKGAVGQTISTVHASTERYVKRSNKMDIGASNFTDEERKQAKEE